MSAVPNPVAKETVRAFFALEPSEPARESALRVSSGLLQRRGGEDVRWVPAENLHVTMRFLGDVATSSLPSLGRRVAEEVAGEPRPTISLGVLGRFPERGKARVVVISIESAEALAGLSSALDRALVAEGFAPETRPFRPHLTLGRVRRGGRAPDLEPAPEFDAATFSVDDVVLFRSELGSGGARYHALERMSLGVSDHPTNASLEE